MTYKLFICYTHIYICKYVPQGSLGKQVIFLNSQADNCFYTSI